MKQECYYCGAPLRNKWITHNCSEFRFRTMENKVVKAGEMKQGDICSPDRTYDDKFEEAEIMTNLEYTNDDYDGINLELVGFHIIKMPKRSNNFWDR